MEIISQSVKDTLSIGRKIAKNLQRGDIVCLFGEFGAGKTVLVKGIALGQGIQKDKIISPSFIFLRQHYAKTKAPFYHFDLYRLKTPKDILALGYEEYFYGDGLTVVEWADRLMHLLPKEYLKIELFIRNNSFRLLKFTGIGRRYKELLRKIYEDIRH